MCMKGKSEEVLKYCTNLAKSTDSMQSCLFDLTLIGGKQLKRVKKLNCIPVVQVPH